VFSWRTTECLFAISLPGHSHECLWNFGSARYSQLHRPWPPSNHSFGRHQFFSTGPLFRNRQSVPPAITLRGFFHPPVPSATPRSRSWNDRSFAHLLSQDLFDFIWRVCAPRWVPELPALFLAGEEPSYAQFHFSYGTPLTHVLGLDWCALFSPPSLE